MSYDVRLMPQALKDIETFRGKHLLQIEEVILGLYDEPRARQSRKLVGGGSRWRIRVGDYRILYEIDDSRNVIRIYRIAHRKEVYR